MTTNSNSSTITYGFRQSEIFSAKFPQFKAGDMIVVNGFLGKLSFSYGNVHINGFSHTRVHYNQNGDTARFATDEEISSYESARDSHQEMVAAYYEEASKHGRYTGD